MPFQNPLRDAISSDESEALARFVHDLETRMEQVADLLNERGTANAAILAGSITRDLRSLETLLCPNERQLTADAVQTYCSTPQ